MSESLRQIRVLHVDDQPDVTDLAKTFLERENDRLRVLTATEAEAGLSVLSEATIDCVVSDYEMPGRNGVEFLEAVREEYEDLPFILYTGKGSEEIASEAISAGVTDYLQKETGTDQYAILANRIENAVDGWRAGRERRRQLEAIEAAQEGISILDEDATYTYVNEAYADLYGYEPEEMIGEGWELVYREEDVESIREDVLAEVYETGHWHGTTTGLRADGTTFVEDHVLATTSDGELVCSVRDDTERRERKAELERIEGFFTQAERVGDLGAWQYDPENGAIWSDGARRIVGVDDDRPPTVEASLEFVHPADRDRLREVVEAALADGTEFDERCWIVQTDGTERWVRISGGPVDDGGEEPTIRGYIQDVTEQREREAELERISARLQALFDHSPDMINVHDADGTILDPNPTLCEKTGYDAATLTGMAVWELDTDIDEATARRIWDEMETGDRRSVEGEYRRADGSTFPVEVHIAKFEMDGDPTFVVVSRDVSDQRDREAELRRSERLFRAVFEDPNILVGHLDVDGTVLDINRTALEYVDSDVESLVGTPFSETPWFTGDPDLQERVREWVRRAADGEYVEFEADLTTAVGRELFIEGVVRPVTDESGDVVSLLVSDRDVTPRRQRERELEQFETVIETVPDGVFIVDGSGTVVLVNDAGADLVGVDVDDLEGRQFTDLVEAGVYDEAIVEEYAESVREMLAARPERKFVQQEHRATVDGETRVHEFHLALRPFEDDFRGTIGVVRDVTEQRRMDRARKRQNERLQRFASIVSHDLRNPLNVANSRLELAREDGDDEHLAAVEDAHGRMEAMIEDLLQLARDGDSGGETSPVDLEEVVADSWRTIDAPGATLETRPLGTVRADRSRLRQLLENLFRNAVEHGSTDAAAGEGSSRATDVGVEVGPLDDGFYVADDGPGIDSEHHGDVFEYGYSTGKSGTGLGLSIVDQVAEDHGWTLEVTDAETGGARFEVTGVEFVDE